MSHAAPIAGRDALHQAILRAMCLLAVAISVAVLPVAAVAQQQDARSASGPQNFLNPFPENDTWRGLVVGDYFAEGLLAGLLDAMSTETRLQLQRKHRVFNGLARVAIDDDLKALDDIVAKEKIHIVVLMMGSVDRTGIRLPNGRRLLVNRDDWRTQYAARADSVVKLLRRRGVAVYWVGHPIMRRQDWNDDVEAMNEVFRERAMGNGVRYIDAFKESADENGQFSDRGVDVTGKPVRLRDPEGYDFTQAGYRKLAFFLERELKRDMSTARSERTIPLAGSEIEQKRITPDRTKLAVTAAQMKAAGEGKALPAGLPTALLPGQQPSPAARAIVPTVPAPQTEAVPGDQRAETVRVSFKSAGAGGKEEQVTLDILRPAISASVVALVTRRDKGDKPSALGDTLTDTLSNGLMVMRSITASRDGASRSGGRPAPTQQPFFIALSKGERLPPKPGRADDFRWPREDDLPPPPLPAAAPAQAPIASPVPLRQPRGAPRVQGGGNRQ